MDRWSASAADNGFCLLTRKEDTNKEVVMTCMDCLVDNGPSAEQIFDALRLHGVYGEDRRVVFDVRPFGPNPDLTAIEVRVTGLVCVSPIAKCFVLDLSDPDQTFGDGQYQVAYNAESRQGELQILHVQN